MASEPLEKALTGIASSNVPRATVNNLYTNKFSAADRIRIEAALRFPGMHMGGAEKRQYVRGLVLMMLVHGDLGIDQIAVKKAEYLPRTIPVLSQAIRDLHTEWERAEAEERRQALIREARAAVNLALGVPAAGTLEVDEELGQHVHGRGLHWRRYFQTTDPRTDREPILVQGFCLALVYQWLAKTAANEDFFAYLAGAAAIAEARDVMTAQSRRLAADRAAIARLGAAFRRAELASQQAQIEARHALMGERKGFRLLEALVTQHEAAPWDRITELFAGYRRHYFAISFSFGPEAAGSAHIIAGLKHGQTQKLFDPNFGEFSGAPGARGWEPLIRQLFTSGGYAPITLFQRYVFSRA